MHTPASASVSAPLHHELVFPHTSVLTLDDGREMAAADVIAMLAPFLSAERMARIDAVVAARNYSVCIA
jgi:hypothetical protein